MSADPLLPSPLAVGGVSLLLAGFFACADTALMSLSQARLGALGATEKRFPGALARVLAGRNTVQARYVAGRVVFVSLAAVSLATWVWRADLDPGGRVATGFLAVLSLALVVELACDLGNRAADLMLPWLIVLMRPLELLAAPLAFLTSGFTSLLRWRRSNDLALAEREMELVVEQGEQAGTLRRAPAELIRNVLEFSELTARDAMIPRKQMVGVQLDTPVEDVLKVVTETGHSRYPVFGEDMDDIVSLLCAKDIFQVMQQSLRSMPPPSGPRTLDHTIATPRLCEITRPIKFVSETQPLSSLLAEMKQERQHLAVVVDEFGGTSGIVTLEDVLEEIVGDIQDEYDVEEAQLIEIGRGRILAHAAVPLSDLSDHIGCDLDPEDRYDSLGGMINDLIGAVPPPGTSLVAHGVRFIVRESDEKHVEKVEVISRASLVDGTGRHSAVSV